MYLGAAPGVGKTYRMLDEGQRRRRRGADVVIGAAETYGRSSTVEMSEGLERVQSQTLGYDGKTFTEMDVAAILERNPQVVLVDELAHTNAPGARNAKRWRDVEELLGAGIVVITTLDISQLESLSDVVQSITGVERHETIPDEVVRRADQIELVDMSPEGLRRRLAHGNIYPSEMIDASLASYFRAGNLTALRELALLWVADRVDEGLAAYRADHHIEDPWPARERVVVAITGGPESDGVIRRAARIAAHGTGGELMAVHVARSDGPVTGSERSLGRQRALVEDLGGTFHQVVGDDVATALLDFAQGVNATQLVLGGTYRPRWQQLLRQGVAETLIPLSGDIDVHIVTHEAGGKGQLPPLRRSVSRKRLIFSWLLTGAGLPLLALALHATRGTHSLAMEVLFFLTLAVGVALLGGIVPALIAAVGGALLLNFFFTEPLYTFVIDEPVVALAIIIFPLVAGAVASVVDLAARRASQAARSRAQADTLITLAGSVLRGDRALEALLDRVREAFGMQSVSLLEKDRPSGQWRRTASSGLEPADSLEQADVEVVVRQGLVLALRGRVLPADDRRVLEAFAAHAAVVLERRRLTEEAQDARKLAETNRVRASLLAAVSHDLRTPIAGIKASVSSLRQTDVALSPEDRADLLAGIEESADRLDRLVANLLDMSRVQSGSVEPLIRDVGLDEVIHTALTGIPAETVHVEIPEDLPAARIDAGLVERTVANVVENATRNNPPGSPVRVCASALRDRVEIRVVDHGPGVPDAAKEHIFEPFQRLGDAPEGAGLGLGLAVARGLVEIVGGSLHAEDTPGGGLTMVLSLPAATTTDKATEHRAGLVR